MAKSAKPRRAAVSTRQLGAGCLFLLCFLVFVGIWKFWERILIPFVLNLKHNLVDPLVSHLMHNLVMYGVGLAFAAVCSVWLWRTYVVPRPRR